MYNFGNELLLTFALGIRLANIKNKHVQTTKIIFAVIPSEPVRKLAGTGSDAMTANISAHIHNVSTVVTVTIAWGFMSDAELTAAWWRG